MHIVLFFVIGLALNCHCLNAEQENPTSNTSEAQRLEQAENRLEQAENRIRNLEETLSHYNELNAELVQFLLSQEAEINSLKVTYKKNVMSK